jgi:hypothetical protein
MTEHKMTRHTVAALVALVGSSAGAHEGHGFANPHWHASDLFGLLLVAAVAAGLWWWRGRK